ncbi:hypothetical protein HAX54_044442 [Datura stramonium]|uniref:Uncharacterized protein n=1 Tax=Datura stramonium TaxID=4076 RepID=A0ABS8WIC8_DATST|nr:hypothetical protein [Datura stramonium]
MEQSNNQIDQVIANSKDRVIKNESEQLHKCSKDHPIDLSDAQLNYLKIISEEMICETSDHYASIESEGLVDEDTTEGQYVIDE